MSIVIGAYNAEDVIEQTIRSLQAQSFGDFELIIVNDGSSDGTAKRLQSLSEDDDRIVIIAQPNGGLTSALIHGCNNATGEFIARIDAGDRALPRRLEKQVQFLEQRPDVAALGTGVRRIGPAGEFLGETTQPLGPEDFTTQFLSHGIGLCHPSAMIRTSVYRKAGGYRKQFRFAQDTDLWYRISQHGLLAELPEALLELRIDTGGISPLNSDRQQQLADLAKESNDRLRRNLDDDQTLEKADQVSWSDSATKPSIPESRCRANAEFFIGSQLYALGDSRCRRYLVQAIRHRPTWFRPWAKYLLSYRTMPQQILERLILTSRLIGSRIRAKMWSLRGARIARKVSVGRGSQIEFPRGVSMQPRVVLENDVWLKLVDANARLEIGEFTFLGRGTELDVAQHVSIGSNVLIAPRVFITDHSHNIKRDTLINLQGCEGRPVHIGNDVWIGTGVTILSGVTIADGAVIGAHSVVRKDVGSNEIWAGVPARKIGER